MHSELDHRQFRAVAALFFALFLAGCDAGTGDGGKGFTDAQLDSLRAEMRKEFEFRQLQVKEFALTRDSSYEVSGTVTVLRQTPMGMREYVTPCTANMDRKTHKASWKCQALP